jgi:NAD(P)H-dependent flavin oxidoreductase YrpB (nitropropane dioxygenase family)
MRVPVVMQAPVGPAATVALVVAVSSAGGLGCLAASWTPVPTLREQIRDIQRQLDRPFGVNLVLAFDQHERLELVAEEQVPVVSLSWGVDRWAIARARAAGATVMVQVGDAQAGVQAVSAGADLLVLQGVEAGGHVQARMPLRRLIRELRGRVGVPLFAAGGVAEPSALAAALAAGASGVAAGTAYLAADEADVHAVYRDRLFNAHAADTCLTELFDVGWPNAPHRVLRNSTLEAWHAAGCPPPGHRPGENQPLGTRAGQPIVRYSDAQPTSDTHGDIEAMALYAGCGVDHVRHKEPASAITTRLLRASRAYQ